MATLGSRSILGLWVETTAGAPAGQVIRPPAGTTVYVWDRQTDATLAPVETGLAGHIDPTFYPGVDLFAVSTVSDYSTASTALPEETILDLVALIGRMGQAEAGIDNLADLIASGGGGGGTGGSGNVNALRIVGGSAEQHEGLDIYLVGSAGELAAVQAIAADAPDLSMLVVEA